MFFESLKQVFDVFGAPILVPLVLFIISIVMKIKIKKAFQIAVLASVGLIGFNMMIGAFIPIIAPQVKNMIDTTGFQLPVFDFGWQATSVVAYSTHVGMIFIGLAILLQVVLFLTKWTNIFMPSDLWNNYSFMVWGSMIYLVTNNLALAIGLMIVQNLYVLLFAEVLAKRWSTYYGYPNCALTAPHHVGGVPFAIVLNWILNRLGANKIQINAESLRNKIGFLGEPTTLGLLLGFFIGILGNFNKLGVLSSWGSIATVAITTAAIMAIFPKVAGIFASAFTALTDASKKAIKGAGNDSKKWYISINDAAGYGEPNTLLTGIILIPTMVIIAIVLPGNKTLPVVDLIALPFMIEVIVCLSKGNIFKSLIAGAIYFSIGLWMTTYTAPMFTDVATSVGVTLPTVGLMITSFGILNNPTMGLLFIAFVTKNPIVITLTIVLYFVLYFLVKKNKEKILDFIESEANYGETVESPQEA